MGAPIARQPLSSTVIYGHLRKRPGPARSTRRARNCGPGCRGFKSHRDNPRRVRSQKAQSGAAGPSCLAGARLGANWERILVSGFAGNSGARFGHLETSTWASAIVLAMTYRATIRAYLLEEALAWLLRHSGYRLLIHASQDPDELVMRNGRPDAPMRRALSCGPECRGVQVPSSTPGVFAVGRLGRGCGRAFVLGGCPIWERILVRGSQTPWRACALSRRWPPTTARFPRCRPRRRDAMVIVRHGRGRRHRARRPTGWH